MPLVAFLWVTGCGQICYRGGRMDIPSPYLYRLEARTQFAEDIDIFCIKCGQKFPATMEKDLKQGSGIVVVKLKSGLMNFHQSRTGSLTKRGDLRCVDKGFPCRARGWC